MNSLDQPSDVFRDVTKDFECDTESDVFSRYPMANIRELFVLSDASKVPKDAELFSGEFSLLPVFDNDLEPKHVIGIMDMIIRALATWLKGDGSVHETLSPCLYMRLTDPFVGPQQSLGSHLVLFVEGVKHVYNLFCSVMIKGDGVLYPEDFIIEDNVFPQSDVDAYYSELGKRVKALQSCGETTEFEEAIRLRLQFISNILRLCICLDSGDVKRIRGVLTLKDISWVTGLAKHTGLGEEPVGAFFPGCFYTKTPVLTAKGGRGLIPFSETLETFKDCLLHISKALECPQNDVIGTACFIVNYFSSEPKCAFLRSLVAFIVAKQSSESAPSVVQSITLLDDIRASEESSKKKVDQAVLNELLKSAEECWKNTLRSLCLNSARMHVALEERISEWASLSSKARKEGLKTLKAYANHVCCFVATIYFSLGYRLCLYSLHEHRIVIWILLRLYMHMIPQNLQPKKPEHSSSTIFGMKPDTAYFPPMPKSFPMSSSSAKHRTYPHGKISFSSAYLTFLMAQQLCVLGEFALVRGLLKNTLIREGVQKEVIEKTFMYRVSCLGSCEIAKTLKFDSFVTEADFIADNFDVLYKRSKGYLEKSKSAFEILGKTCFKTSLFIPTIEGNVQSITNLLNSPSRGFQSFKARNIILFDMEKNTIFPVLAISPKP